MPRKKAEPAKQLTVPDLGATPEHIGKAEAEVRERQMAAIERFGDGLPWAPDHYEAAIKSEMRRGCEAFLRAGRYLIVSRECSQHGEWAGMLERIGIGARQAQRMMEAAARIAMLPNASTSTHLIAAAKSEGKLIELLSLPEDQFAELAEGGEAGGLTLDDVEKMTVRELRAALRDARGDLDAKDERAAKREREIERKTAEIQRLKKLGAKATPDEAAEELRQAVNRISLGLRADITATGKPGRGEEPIASLANAFAELAEFDANNDQDNTAFLGGIIGELLGDLRRLRDTYTLPIVNDGAQG